MGHESESRIFLTECHSTTELDCAAPQVAESLDVALTGSSSDLPRRGWLDPCWTAARPTGIGSWTTGARPT